MSYEELSGKVAVITGGAAGIGLATAIRLATEGMRLVLVDLNEEQLATAREQVIEATGVDGDSVRTVAADVTNEAQVQGYVTAATDAFGQIDVLFNNAGIEGRVAPIPELSASDMEAVWRVNVLGAFFGFKYVLPVMYEQGSGSVIVTSSVAGLDGTAGVAPYISSKHAVTGLAKTAALEAAPRGIRVNSIHPSPVQTRMMRSLEAGFAPDNPEGAQAAIAQGIPLGRYGESEEIAALVAFLASDESKFITGAQYRIDGGMGA